MLFRISPQAEGLDNATLLMGSKKGGGERDTFIHTSPDRLQLGTYTNTRGK